MTTRLIETMNLKSVDTSHIPTGTVLIDVPSASDIEKMSVGDEALNPFGQMRPITQIIYRGPDALGKTCACYYTAVGTEQVMNSRAEGSVTRTDALWACLTPREVRAIEQELCGTNDSHTVKIRDEASEDTHNLPANTPAVWVGGLEMDRQIEAHDTHGLTDHNGDLAAIAGCLRDFDPGEQCLIANIGPNPDNPASWQLATILF